MFTRRHYYSQLALRSMVTAIVAYALSMGATYNGILIGRLQWVSLALLSVGVLVWWIKFRRILSEPDTPLGGTLALWGLAYLIASLPNWSGRVAIGLWYAGFYAGVWIVLNDLRRRGLPGRWLTDAALFTAIPLIVLSLAQVASFPY